MAKMAPFFAMAIQQLTRKPKKPKLASITSPLLEYGKSPVRLTGSRLKLTRKVGQYLANGSIPIVADGAPIAGVTGNPVLIQSRSNKGNFELITPAASGGLAHYWRNNDVRRSRGTGSRSSGRNSGLSHQFRLFRADLEIQATWKSLPASAPPSNSYGATSVRRFARNGPTPIVANGISPVLIESRFGAIGNFELLAIEPSFSPNRGIAHYWRNNDDSILPWSESTVFGRDPARQTPIESLTFIQSNLTSAIRETSR
jgi:hypothetical protein